MGTWNTPVLVFVPSAVILVALYFGRRGSWMGCGFLMVLSAVIYWLESAGSLPYAPGMIERSIAAQLDPAWLFGMIAGTVLKPFLICFAFILFVVAARRRQDARLRAAQNLIRRYVPSQLADRIMDGEHSETFRPERVRLTIFFSDVEGFTDASDQLDAEDLAALLNEYLGEMSLIAERYGATINQFVGDGIMIFFGAPQFTSDKDHALRAVRMAVDMQRRLVELKDIWLQRGIRKPFRARIGINTGHASVGDYGSPGRKVYSAIGLQTNIAARIQAQCEPGRVLLSDTTWALVRDEIPATDRGEIQMKGVHYPVQAYEVQAS